ncbi:MAG: extracellular solute-binding protein [Chloroflexi bacterium]|nr:extracellular solute-binding protein [Chloroflexota bacterium]
MIQRCILRTRRDMLLAAMAAGPLLAACGAGDFGGQPTAVPAAKSPATIRVTTVWPDAPIVEAIQAQVDRFTKVAPHITVKFEPAASTGDWLQKRKVEAAAGDAVEVSYHRNFSLAELASLGMLADMAPYVKRDAKAIQSDDILPDVMNAGKYRGKQVGLFWQGTNLLVTVYHTGMFRAAGETTPDALYARGQWTWTRVREVARRLTDVRNEDQKRFGTHAFALGNFNWGAGVLWTFGADLLSQDGTRVTLTTPEAVECFEYFHTLVCRDYSAPVRATDGYEFVRGGAVDQGRIAIVPNWIGSMINAAPQWPFDLAPLPSQRKQASVLSPANTSLLQHAPQKEAGWEFVKFAATPVEQQVMWRRFGQVPVHKQHFDPWMQEVAAATNVKNLRLVPEIMKVARAFPGVPRYSALQELFQKHAFPLLHSCSGPAPKEVCEAISREGTLLLSES